ncbi:MAG: geranylgeranyl reductase family protein [Lentisphaerales bacterium]|nr:geranylgeranyl reductase family protein [Lentisphaerales bacterium]
MKFAIIGSGPAGSSAAYYLSKDGHEVVLIDPKGPNEKTCGGGVPSKSLGRFPEFYKDFIPAETLLEDMVFAFDGSDLCEISMPQGMGIFSRKNHDNHIFQKALKEGATYLQETFKDCERSEAGWIVKTNQQELFVDFILGADGAVSRVRNKLAKKLPREAYFKAIDYLVTHPNLPLHIGFDKKLNGYLWVFPRENNCSIGIVDFDDDQAQRMKFLDDYLARFNVPESEIVKKRSALIPSLRKQDLKEHEISGENWALVGDAAALAEPITGEGIYYAIYSSWLFADCLRKSEDYNKRWKSEFRLIVQEAHISRTSYKFLNRGFIKFFLKRSSLLRKMTGEHLAAFETGRTHRIKFFMSLPLIAVQALFSKSVKV